MGTTSTVKFYKWDPKNPTNKKLIAAVYQQYDGYISGVGHDLAGFLMSKKIINGIPSHIMIRNIKQVECANGPGCLAAQYIAMNKTEIGGLYMTTDDDTQDYNYEVYIDMQQYFSNPESCIPWIEVRSYSNELIFEGTPKELLNFNENED